MKCNKKRIISIVLVVALSTLVCGMTFAHSGRTDSNGGHRDNKNKSGLGSYHYHCGGHPAHLHENGVCPYSSKTSKKSAETVLNSNDIYNNSNSSSTINSTINESIDQSSIYEDLNTTSEDSNPMANLISIGVLAGGGYLGYKKYNNKK